MGKRHDTDKAIRNIIKWSETPEWSDSLLAILDNHLVPVGDMMDMEFDKLINILYESGLYDMIHPIMFEDFLSSDMDDGSNIIDDYLKRRGWRESVKGRQYLQKLRDSKLSLYEVVDVSPGRHCDIKDLILGGKVRRVYENSGTQQMIKWDRIAARVLRDKGKYIFSGGILPFQNEPSQTLVNSIKNRDGIMDEVGEKQQMDAEQLKTRKDELETLIESPIVYTSIWLMHNLAALNSSMPTLVNRDGDEIMFIQTRFPFLEENAKEIAKRLDADKDWNREDPSNKLWNWLTSTDPGEPQEETNDKVLNPETLEYGQLTIAAFLELKDTALILETNSTQRNDQVTQKLQTLLKILIGPPLSKIETPEQKMSTAVDNPEQNKQQRIDPETEAEILQTYLDQHYRKILDEPIPMLNDKTPRQCANNSKDKEMVIDWLKYLENNEHRRSAQDDQKPYDTQWIWEKLNLLEERDK